MEEINTYIIKMFIYIIIVCITALKPPKPHQAQDLTLRRKEASENNNKNLIQQTYKREENTFIRYKY